MARYVKQQMPDLQKTGEKKYYHRIMTYGNVSTAELIRLASKHESLHKGVLEHALGLFSQVMAEKLAEGWTVTLNGIGTFQATLGVPKKRGTQNEQDNNATPTARDIDVTNVRYVSDKNFVALVREMCDLKKVGTVTVNRSPYTKEQRLKMAQEYLADPDHAYMRSADYAELTSLPRSTAAKELKQFAKDPSNGIGTDGNKTAKIYIKKKAATV